MFYCHECGAEPCPKCVKEHDEMIAHYMERGATCDRCKQVVIGPRFNGMHLECSERSMRFSLSGDVPPEGFDPADAGETW